MAGRYLDIFHVVENPGHIFANQQGVIIIFSIKVIPFVAVWISLWLTVDTCIGGGCQVGLMTFKWLCFVEVCCFLKTWLSGSSRAFGLYKGDGAWWARVGKLVLRVKCDYVTYY